jgi:hypothetical protein
MMIVEQPRVRNATELVKHSRKTYPPDITERDQALFCEAVQNGAIGVVCNI